MWAKRPDRSSAGNFSLSLTHYSILSSFSSDSLPESIFFYSSFQPILGCSISSQQQHPFSTWVPFQKLVEECSSFSQHDMTANDEPDEGEVSSLMMWSEQTKRLIRWDVRQSVRKEFMHTSCLIWSFFAGRRVDASLNRLIHLGMRRSTLLFFLDFFLFSLFKLQIQEIWLTRTITK